tara:strand:+ start:6532 stop:7221 length:690 start_codon:yes stop_codon:yes gene_type:complete
MKKKILIVEDDSSIANMLVFNLDNSGYSTSVALSGVKAKSLIFDFKPDLILMDWMLPDISGIELIREFKRDEISASIPVIMLTARSLEDDKVLGLDSGADDYVTKPYSYKELEARINATLRKLFEKEKDLFEVGSLKIDRESQRVYIKGMLISLGPKEYNILNFFTQNQNKVFSRAQLLDNIWGRNIYIDERTIDVHIRRLRSSLAIEGCDRMIQTVRGSGYRFSSEVK